MANTNLKSRRAFLRGAAGAAVAIPLLPSLLPKAARAQAPRPTRFVAVLNRFGRDPDHWYPTARPLTRVAEGVHAVALSDLRADGAISPTFGDAWNGLESKFSMLRGLDGLDDGNPHDSTMCLTASGKKSGNRSTIRFAYSLDAVLEESPGFNGPDAAPMLRTTPFPTTLFNNDHRPTVRTVGTEVERPASERDPHQVYASLFGASTAPNDNGSQARQRRASVLNGVMEDYGRLVASRRISAADSTRLEAYLDRLSDVERRLQITVPSCSGAAAPGAMGNAVDLHDAMFDLEVLALSCDRTRIVVHTIRHHKSGLDLRGEEAHSTAHGRTFDPGGGAPIVHQRAGDRWKMDRVASLLHKLDAVPDGDGSLLDHTVFMHSNHDAHGHHRWFDMPVIVAGAPNHWRLGEYIDYRTYPIPDNVDANGRRHHPGRPYNQLLTSIFHILGITPAEYEKFGRAGFGEYAFDRMAGYRSEWRSHYEGMVSNRRATLPYALRD
ncbi:MAG: DUF1552 domain-containing protein [Myxococcota bacterium]